jgi:hypothetical protein
VPRTPPGACRSTFPARCSGPRLGGRRERLSPSCKC